MEINVNVIERETRLGTVESTRSSVHLLVSQGSDLPVYIRIFFSRVKKHSAGIDTEDFFLLESQLILKTKKKCGNVGRARALSTQSRCRATAAQTKLLRERERKRNDADRVMSIISDVTYIEGSR